MLFGNKKDYPDDGMHALYYANIPYQKKTVKTWLGPHRQLINDTAPYFLYTGTGWIDKLPTWYPPVKTANKLKKKQINFYLYEPAVFYDNRVPALNRSHYHEFIDNDVTHIRCQEFDAIDKWARKNEFNVRVVTCDRNSSLLKEFYPNIDIVCRDVFIRGLFNTNSQIATQKDISKKFYCFNWRYTFHRHAAAAFCTDLDCDFSWPFVVKESDIEECNWLTSGVVPIRAKTQLLNEGKFIVDKDFGKVEVEVGGVSCPYTDWQPMLNHNKDLNKYFCGIITETRYAQPFPNISEKVLNAVATSTPFVLMAPPKSLEYMKELGFKTFDRWWSEDYDAVENHEQRLYAIKDVLDFINNKTIEELKVIYDEMEEVLSHNLNVLKNLRTDKIILP